MSECAFVVAFVAASFCLLAYLAIVSFVGGLSMINKSNNFFCA